MNQSADFTIARWATPLSAGAPALRLKLLLVEDTLAGAFLIEQMLRESGELIVELDHVSRLADAVQAQEGCSYNLILLDPMLPDSLGTSTVQAMRAAAPTTPIIVLSDLADQEIALAALQAGAQDYLFKERISPDVLVRVIRYTLARAQAINDLLESEAKYREVIEQAADGIFMSDLQGNLLEVNPAAAQILGYSREELLQANVIDFMIVPDAVASLQRLSKWPTGSTLRTEQVLRRKDGSTVFVEANAKVVRPGLLQATIRDMSERRRSEEQLRAREADLRAIVAALREGVVVRDASGAITHCNQSAEQILGLTADQMMDRAAVDPLWRAVHEDGSPFPGDTHPAMNSLRSGQPYQDVIMGVHKPDGSLTWISIDTQPLFHPGATEPYGVVTSFSDITARKKADEELHARQAAEAASRAKSQFLSSMSHELRTPLNAIIGFAQLLEMDDLLAEQHASVEYILTAGRHLLGVIGDVLDISLVESGRLHLSPEPVRLTDMMPELLHMLRPTAERRGIEIAVALQDGEALPVLADNQRLRQVLLNLLSNAVKYNRDGGIVTVAATLNRETGRLRICVRDTGRGIAPEDLDRLFTSFERIGAEQSNIEGSGLGLALVKSLAEAMNGAVGVDSVPGQGSTFWVELPLAVEVLPQMALAHSSRDALRRPEDVRSARSITILYMEDNPTNIQLMKQIIKMRPELRLVVSTDGLDALAVRGLRPDVILLDLHLPGLQGDQVLRELQADPATRDIPTFIISADASRHQIERLLDSGARAYLTKPLNVRHFLELLDDLIEDRAGLEAG